MNYNVFDDDNDDDHAIYFSHRFQIAMEVADCVPDITDTDVLDGCLFLPAIPLRPMAGEPKTTEKMQRGGVVVSRALVHNATSDWQWKQAEMKQNTDACVCRTLLHQHLWNRT